ncbi:hypothetical protein BCR34DRAFT_391779 [Clohesyomyces aquaticus]|uniref:Uncharacterized protein n=1 Tax=Clohesyomyces aquaticus TaxID=1231657 RepID=A0A1Y1ZED6_9PLEO|nr:hypothetical protein BCR34DRAFT_391779 [Clohesyomyces aquaticus]
MFPNHTSTTTSTSNALHVICAWPVSGQYGAGSRMSYYVLIVVLVFARKFEQVREAALAAALLFPTVAGIHGIVLAAVHVNGAVDMDVYGAFQLCAIGIVAAPFTLNASRTYVQAAGRNIILVLTSLILAGLIALTIEFYRVTASPCPYDDNNTPISSNPDSFPYGGATCGLLCSEETGPHSPMRGGTGNNIYIIPTPHRLSPNTAMLLSAGCCIPAILSIISILIQMLSRQDPDGLGDPIEGTNGATLGAMHRVDGMTRVFLSVVKIPLFMGGLLAILIVGEVNLFSKQVTYQTEPFVNVGQWGPVAGIFLGLLGPFYMVLALTNGSIDPEIPLSRSRSQTRSPSLASIPIPAPNPGLSPGQEIPPQLPFLRLSPASTPNSYPFPTPSPVRPPISQLPFFRPSPNRTMPVGDGRRKVAQALTRLASEMSEPHDPNGPLTINIERELGARDFPEVPGEIRGLPMQGQT